MKDMKGFTAFEGLVGTPRALVLSRTGASRLSLGLARDSDGGVPGDGHGFSTAMDPSYSPLPREATTEHLPKMIKSIIVRINKKALPSP